MKNLLHWTIIAPIISIIAYFLNLSEINAVFQVLVGILLMLSILSAVHHAEAIAYKVGEPYGTIILAVAITIIEVALIVSLMLSGGEKALTLARDTVFSSVMILFNAALGLCLVLGSTKHFEQYFQKKSVNIALVSLVAILVLTLILPNYTTSIGGGRYSTPQLFFAAFACLAIYGTFLGMQTVRHRDYFISATKTTSKEKMQAIAEVKIGLSLLLLVACLTIVVLLAKSLSPLIEQMVIEANLPHALVGIIIASVVLLPEIIAAVKAAIKNDIQTSINLSLGSALAAIGLTIPAVAIVSTIFDLDIVLGISQKSMVLLALSIFTVMLSLSKGKTNLLYGVVLLINFIAFVFTTIFA